MDEFLFTLHSARSFFVWEKNPKSENIPSDKMTRVCSERIHQFLSSLETAFAAFIGTPEQQPFYRINCFCFMARCWFSAGCGLWLAFGRKIRFRWFSCGEAEFISITLKRTEKSILGWYLKPNIGKPKMIGGSTGHRYSLLHLDLQEKKQLTS